MRKLSGLLILAVLLGSPPGVRAEDDLRDQAVSTLRKAGRFWAEEVVSHGGFVWEYDADLGGRRRGESGDLPPSTNWVQPPGTPSVGAAFLAAYEATGEKAHLDAALAAGRSLVWGQLASGGWDYRIEHDLTRNRHRYHHLRGTGRRLAGLRNTTTFDDDTTQSATRFLMALDGHVDDPGIDAAIRRALLCFLEAQYRGGAWDGAWPQRYPPPKGYGAYPTFNDNTMSDCVRTILAAYRQYSRPVHLASVKRCLAFNLRAQLPEPQPAWAQQYDEELKPAWARKFEPAAVSGAESAGNLDLLLDMFLEFGDDRYLEAAGRAAAWFRRSRIGGTEEAGIWARFYEWGTNRPLYFTRTYRLVYTDDDLPVHYSFKGNYGVNRRILRYEEILRRGRRQILAAREREDSPEGRRRRATSLEARVRRIVADLDDRGRWVEVVVKREQVRDEKGRVGYEVDEKTRLRLVTSRTFVRKMHLLAEYVSLVR